VTQKTINLCGGWCKLLQQKRKKEQLTCGNEKEKYQMPRQKRKKKMDVAP